MQIGSIGLLHSLYAFLVNICSLPKASTKDIGDNRSGFGFFFTERNLNMKVKIHFHVLS